MTPDGHTQVTPMPLGAEVEGERLGDADDGVLAGDVGQPVEAVGEQPRCRRGVHDVAVALVEEVGEEHEVAAGDAQQVQVEDPLPRLERQRLRRAHGEHADVVHHEVEAAEPVEAPVPQRLEVAPAR